MVDLDQSGQVRTKVDFTVPAIIRGMIKMFEEKTDVKKGRAETTKIDVEDQWLNVLRFDSPEKHQKKEMYIIERARGLSFDSLSKKLKISKKTALNWSKQFKLEIHNLKQIEMDRIRAEFLVNKVQRVKFLGAQLQSVYAELSKPEVFKDANPIQLLQTMIKLIETLKSEEEPLIFREEARSQLLSDKEWIAE